jgi:hypothetical protein
MRFRIQVVCLDDDGAEQMQQVLARVNDFETLAR